MKAVQFAEYGEPEVLRVVEVDEPHAGPGQVRVRVRAASVNPFDWKLRSGALREMMPVPLPATLGTDVAGVVDEVGDGIGSVAVGDEVFGFAVSGGFAQFAVLEHLAAKPPAMSFEQAAGLPLVTETALRVLDLLGVKAGQTVLINGASGGVGTAATQFAVGRGASVIGTASEPNHEYLRSLGATPVTYGEGLAVRVHTIAPHGVDVAFDAAGFGALPDLIELAGGPENVVTIADFSAGQYGVRISGGEQGRAYEALGLAARLLAEGAFTMPIAQTFSMDQAGAAHRVSQGGHVRGKLVVIID